MSTYKSHVLFVSPAHFPLLQISSNATPPTPDIPPRAPKSSSYIFWEISKVHCSLGDVYAGAAGRYLFLCLQLGVWCIRWNTAEGTVKSCSGSRTFLDIVVSHKFPSSSMATDCQTFSRPIFSFNLLYVADYFNLQDEYLWSQMAQSWLFFQPAIHRAGLVQASSRDLLVVNISTVSQFTYRNLTAYFECRISVNSEVWIR